MNAPTPRLSIGLPVYNGEPFLADAIDSLLTQTFRDFELIISDNASTDGTEAICRERAARDPRVRYLRSDTNRGATWNFNRVFELARGEYFKWAAHDDRHEPAFLARCVEALDRDPEVVLACTRLVDIDEHDAPHPVEELHMKWDSPHQCVRFRALARPDHRCESIFGVIRTEVLRRTPLLSDYAGCDRVLLAEIALAGRFHEVPEVLFLHREHRRRSTRAYNDEQTRTEWFDPAKAGRPAFPHMKMLRGYTRVIRRSRVARMHKAVCMFTLVGWTLRNRPGLWKDLTFALRHTRRSRVTSAAATTPPRASHDRPVPRDDRAEAGHRRA